MVDQGPGHAAFGTGSIERAVHGVHSRHLTCLVSTGRPTTAGPTRRPVVIGRSARPTSPLARSLRLTGPATGLVGPTTITGRSATGRPSTKDLPSGTTRPNDGHPRDGVIPALCLATTRRRPRTVVACSVNYSTTRSSRRSSPTPGTFFTTRGADATPSPSASTSA